LIVLDGIVPPLIVIFGAAVLLWLRHLYVNRHSGHPPRADAAVVVGLILLTATLEIGMGRPLAYKNGPMRLWVGDVNSDQNSQQLLDPYSFTHVIHGALFYGLTHLAMGPASVGARTVVAVALESAWEAYENTDTVINRYRSVTIALGYFGDSVTNSMVDIVACLIGFVLAYRLPWRWTLAWVVVTEIALALTIRDNLTLNIIMLIRPIEAIKRWQLGS
jgi:Protein of unknown function (DUF2585)